MKPEYGPDRVATYGMYACSVMHEIAGNTVDEIVENWKTHNTKKHPAKFWEGRIVDDLGPSSLYPAIVLRKFQEIRRVGNTVLSDGKGLEDYRQALLNDPDIPRLLRERSSKPRK